MSQRRVLLEEDLDSYPLPFGIASGNDGAVDMLMEMESVLQFSTPDGAWHARAKGCSHHASGRNPGEAMERALKLRMREQHK